MSLTLVATLIQAAILKLSSITGKRKQITFEIQALGRLIVSL